MATGRSKDRAPGRLVDFVEGRCGSLLPATSVFSMNKKLSYQLIVRRKKRFEKYNVGQ